MLCPPGHDPLRRPPTSCGGRYLLVEHAADCQAKPASSRATAVRALWVPMRAARCRYR